MNFRLYLMKLFLPVNLKKEKLHELFGVTAAAFQTTPPVVEGLRFNDLLQEYATFTRAAAMQQIIKGEDVSLVMQRLYDGAYRIGEELREEMRIRSRKDAMKAARLLYRAMGIDFHCSGSGEVGIARCYFSTFYPPEVCWIISSLDEGIIAGLTDGGRLWFVSRITEGNNSCVGQIEFLKNP
ncbi:MAG TPA: hypothetical protein VLX91_05595 [Candidatus Acidoferrales bacterium]|nr:hypothetical protein [Candidatus Acidoferrales bacterium]